MYSTVEVFLHLRSGCFWLMLWYCFLNDLSVRKTFLTFESRKQCDNLTSEITWHKVYRRYTSISTYPLCGFKKRNYLLIAFLWTAILAKSWDLFSWQTVAILLRAVEILVRTIEILLRTVEIFMMNGRDFHIERSKFSWWTVEIFTMNGRDFHVERSRFSWWTVEIFMMNGRDFHDERSNFHVERSRFLCWTI